MISRCFWALGSILAVLAPVNAQIDPVAAKFKEIDTNGDGKISPEEFKKFPDLAARFKGADKDGDGLTLAEARAHMAAEAGRPNRQPSKNDARAREKSAPIDNVAPISNIKEGPKILSPVQAGVGRMVPDLTCKTILAESLKLSELTGKNALVIAFTSTTCPISKKYGPSLTQLERVVQDLGLKILFVNPTATDDPEGIRAFVARHKLKSPYVHDKAGELAKSVQATTTAEVFLLDAKRTVIYRGALDDQYGLGYALDQPKRVFLADAIGELLAGKQPDPAATTAPGCALDLAAVKGVGVTNDYFGRIARIMMANCVECHRTGGVAPFRLDRPEDLIAHAGMIAKVVDKGTMPPWFAAPAPGGKKVWANDRTLPADDKADLLAWLKSDRPKGDAAQAPLARTYQDGWLIGKPDLELQFDKPVAVKATGTIPYVNVTIDAKVTEDKWVRSIEIRPTAREVVHHVLVFVVPPGRKVGQSDDDDDVDGTMGGFFGLYVPGNSVISYPQGYAKKLPKGSRLVFQMHYTPNGTETTDQTRIGLAFADKPPAFEVKTLGLVNTHLNIPPGADNHPETATLRIPATSTVLGFFPHMHLRGKAFRFEISPPNQGGESGGVAKNKPPSEIILDVPVYDFNWQLFYRLAEPRALSPGTVLKATGWFDNSDKNPANPDPTKRVRWGPQTTEEMMLGYVEYIVPAEGGKK